MQLLEVLLVLLLTFFADISLVAATADTAACDVEFIAVTA
jgi:hypothetical protein